MINVARRGSVPGVGAGRSGQRKFGRRRRINAINAIELASAPCIRLVIFRANARRIEERLRHPDRRWPASWALSIRLLCAGCESSGSGMRGSPDELEGVMAGLRPTAIIVLPKSESYAMLFGNWDWGASRDEPLGTRISNLRLQLKTRISKAEAIFYSNRL